MIDISMEMEQSDCPYIATTADHSLAFSTFTWEFNEADRELETRMAVQGEHRDAIDSGLQVLLDHPHLHDFRLLKRRENTAQIYTVIDETDAMNTIRSNSGYITAPFHVADGSEVWHVGFDTPAQADRALSELDRNHELAVLSRQQTDTSDLLVLMRNNRGAIGLLEGLRDLSEVERQTLEAAINKGYFESPRQTTLSKIADDFGISKTAVSKNLRRCLNKMDTCLVELIEDLEPL
jgi:predicted DNA binding protein